MASIREEIQSLGRGTITKVRLEGCGPFERFSIVVDGGGGGGGTQPQPQQQQAAQITPKEGIAFEGEITFIVRHVSALPTELGQYVESAPFKLGNRYWIFKMYPGGNTQQYSGCVAAYLRPYIINTVPIPMSVNFKTFTAAPSNARILGDCGNVDQIGTVSSGYGFGNEYLVKREIMNSAASQFDDTIIIKASLKLYSTELLTPSNKTNQSQQQQQQSSSSISSVLNDISALWKNNSIPGDVILIAKGESFKAHKAILSARSNVFKKMFFGSFKEGKSNNNGEPVELQDIEPEILEFVLEFIYTGKITTETKNNSLELWESLLTVGDMFDLKDLRDLCQEKLTSMISSQNVTRILNLATRFVEASNLKEAALNYFKYNPVEMEEVSKLDIQALREIVVRNANLILHQNSTPITSTTSTTTLISIKEGKQQHDEVTDVIEQHEEEEEEEDEEEEEEEEQKSKRRKKN